MTYYKSIDIRDAMIQVRDNLDIKSLVASAGSYFVEDLTIGDSTNNSGATLHVEGNAFISNMPTSNSTTSMVVEINGLLAKRDISTFGFLTSYSETDPIYTAARPTIVMHKGNVGDGTNITDVSTQIDNETITGIYTTAENLHAEGLVVYNFPSSSLGTIQQYFDYSGNFRYRNKTDNTNWSPWKYVATQDWVNSNFYSKIQLQTTGQSSVHWDNITNKPTIVSGEVDTLQTVFDRGNLIAADNNRILLRRTAADKYLGIAYQVGSTDHWFLGSRETGTSFILYNYNTISNAISVSLADNAVTMSAQVTALDYYINNSNGQVASSGNLYLRGGGTGSIYLQPNTGLPSAIELDTNNTATFTGNIIGQNITGKQGWFRSGAATGTEQYNLYLGNFADNPAVPLYGISTTDDSDSIKIKSLRWAAKYVFARDSSTGEKLAMVLDSGDGGTSLMKIYAADGTTGYTVFHEGNHIHRTDLQNEAVFHPLENQRLGTLDSPTFAIVKAGSNGYGQVELGSDDGTNVHVRTIDSNRNLNLSAHGTGSVTVSGNLVWHAGNHIHRTDTQNDSRYVNKWEHWNALFTVGDSTNTDGKIRILSAGAANSGYIEWRQGGTGDRIGYIGFDNSQMFYAAEIGGHSFSGPITTNSTITASSSITGITEALGENSTKMASTAWVKGQGYLTAESDTLQTVFNRGSQIIADSNWINLRRTVSSFYMGIAHSTDTDVQWFVGQRENSASYKIYNFSAGADAISISNGTNVITAASLAGTGTRMVVADSSGTLTTQALPTGTITGAGTTNYVTKWASSSSLTNSTIYDDGSLVGVGLSNPNHKFTVAGGADEALIALFGQGMGNVTNYIGVGNALAADDILFIGYNNPSNYGGFVVGGDSFGAGLNIHRQGKVSIGAPVANARVQITDNVAQGTVIIQNTHTQGWSSIDFANATGSYVGGIGYGNTGASTFADKVYIYSNNKTIAFSTDGSTQQVTIDTAGTIAASGGDSIKWTAAHGWGNHASAGYYTYNGGLLNNGAKFGVWHNWNSPGILIGGYLNVSESNGAFNESYRWTGSDAVHQTVLYGQQSTDTNGYAFVIKTDSKSTLTPATTERLIIDINGSIKFLNGSGFTYNGNTIWHAGNDGSGSGLDADLLDGYNASIDWTTATNIAARGTDGSLKAWALLFTNDGSKYIYYNNVSDEYLVGTNTIEATLWHSVNHIHRTDTQNEALFTQGSGTANYLPKWTATRTLADSVIYENNGNIGIGTTSLTRRFNVAGGGQFGSILEVTSASIDSVILASSFLTTNTMGLYCTNGDQKIAEFDVVSNLYSYANGIITVDANTAAITATGAVTANSLISNSSVKVDLGTINASLLSSTRAYELPNASGTLALESWVNDNYVPETRTITINGTTQDLTTDRTWTVSASPGGTDRSIQFNDNGVLNGSGQFYLDASLNVNVNNRLYAGSLRTSAPTGGGTAVDWKLGSYSGGLAHVQIDTTARYLVGSDRTLTINGVTQDLSSDRTWNIYQTTSSQTHTSGSTVTIGNNTDTSSFSQFWVNPSSILASLTITLPAQYAPPVLHIVFGGAITSGTVVSNLSFAGSAGWSTYSGSLPKQAKAGDHIILYKNGSNAGWYGNANNDPSHVSNIQVYTSNATATTNDHAIIVDATGGNVTVTLPAASTCPRKVFHVKMYADSGLNYTATLNTAGGTLRDGASGVNQFASTGGAAYNYMLVSDGTDYRIFSQF